MKQNSWSFLVVGLIIVGAASVWYSGVRVLFDLKLGYNDSQKQIPVSYQSYQQDIKPGGVQDAAVGRDPLNNNSETLHVTQSRMQVKLTPTLDRIKSVCQRGGIRGGRVKGVFRFQKQRALYCFIPKAGCTFWKRVYIIMQIKQSKVTKDSMFSVKRHDVHQLAGFGSTFNPTADGPSQFPLRFQVSREPFSRLVSSYLDKAYLPGFWFTEIAPLLIRNNLRGQHRTHMEADFLRGDFENMHRLFGNLTEETKKIRSTTDDAQCGKYATFAEFVQLSLGREEPHWMPMTQLCDPCQFNPTHVVRMENFSSDAAAILNHMGVKDVMEDLDKESQVNEELRTIVEDNFGGEVKGGQKAAYDKCVTPREIAYRLWNNFQWRGYIHPHVDYKPPSVQESAAVMKDLYSQIDIARKRGLAEPLAMKTAKKKFRDDIILSLPAHLFKAVLEKYKLDFELFGYDRELEKVKELYNTHLLAYTGNDAIIKR